MRRCIALLAAFAVGCDDGSGRCTAACEGDVALRCGEAQERVDCAAEGQVCVDGECRICRPGASRCCGAGDSGCEAGLDVLACDQAGGALGVAESCDPTQSEVCDERAGEASCRDACEAAAARWSNLGCEFFAVDLDNAVVEMQNAAEQPLGIVLKNPGPLSAHVIVEQDNAVPHESPIPMAIREVDLIPDQQIVIADLPPREVDGSGPGTFGTGTETAWTRNAYRVTASAPIAAYQFNPLQVEGAFSNDASLLLPTAAVGGADGSRYVVMGWPQLIADTDNPATDAAVDLRSFLTIVGTQAGTHVSIQTRSDILGDGDIAATAAGGTLDLELGPFDVVNLESDGFRSDFTGSVVTSDLPVVVFSGSECGDVPAYSTRDDRKCCCDHMEEQLAPAAAFGRAFAAVQTPRRTAALADAGAGIEPLSTELEVWRLLSATDTTCATTLPEPLDEIDLVAGEVRTIEASQDFLVDCDAPVQLAQFVEAAEAVIGGAPEPAGDPSFIMVPPVEQHRIDYRLVVPDGYAFDFVVVAARSGADVTLDGASVDDLAYCTRSALGTVVVEGMPVAFDAIRCALSEPIITSGPPLVVEAGVQRDGAHRVASDQPVGVVLYGFDAFVSYGCAAGTELRGLDGP